MAPLLFEHDGKDGEVPNFLDVEGTRHVNLWRITVIRSDLCSIEEVYFVVGEAVDLCQKVLFVTSSRASISQQTMPHEPRASQSMVLFCGTISSSRFEDCYQAKTNLSFETTSTKATPVNFESRSVGVKAIIFPKGVLDQGGSRILEVAWRFRGVFVATLT